MKKLTSQEDLAGKTIRACIDEMDGNGIVLVFDDNDWCVIGAEHGNDDTVVNFDYSSHGDYGDIKKYLTPSNLLAADLVSRPQYDLLVAEAKRKEADRKRKIAQRLIYEANALENSTAA